jgi:hypothetical protein
MSISKLACFGIEFDIVTGIDEPPNDPAEKYIITPSYCSELPDAILNEIFTKSRITNSKIVSSSNSRLR